MARTETRKAPSMDGKGMDVPQVLFMPDIHHICEYELKKTALYPNARKRATNLSVSSLGSVARRLDGLFCHFRNVTLGTRKRGGFGNLAAHSSAA